MPTSTGGALGDDLATEAQLAIEVTIGNLAAVTTGYREAAMPWGRRIVSQA
jgi:hypothetical protein